MSDQQAARPGYSPAAIGIASLLVALTFLPLGDWLNLSFQRALEAESNWLQGSVVVVLTATLLYLMFRGERGDAIARAADRVVGWWDRYPVRTIAIVSVAATIVYAGMSWFVFDARPLLIDELVQVFQARTFASGRLWLPVDQYPEFRSIMHMVEQDGRWYSQFPPGGPAMLALGELVRAPWLVNPVFAGVGVAAFSAAMRFADVRPRVAVGATLLFAFCPFVVFQSASHMNHVTSLAWLMIATAALVRATSHERQRPVAALVCGVALGVAATIRPLDAGAFALPAAAWLAWRAWRSGHWKALIASGAGVAVPFLAMMYVNQHTTGGPFTFGYSVLWGPLHGLGFHESPWGEHHTPARGLALTAAYFNRLSEYFLDAGIPSLLPAIAALGLAHRRTPLERYLLSSAALVVAVYFVYWHDGFFLGPRFFYPLAAIAALLTARLPEIWAFRTIPAQGRAIVAVYAAAILAAVTLSLPRRVVAYAGGFQSMRPNYDQLATNAGAAGGVILVRESWGAQVIQRLWALGVSRSFTEVLYRHVDTCGLDDMVTRLEGEGVRGTDAEARLRPMLADSARVVGSPMSPDATERVLPGSVYPPICLARIREDRNGYTLFGPMLLARDATTRWVRDLHARDTLVIREEELRNAWLLRRGPDEKDWTLYLTRIDSDSALRAWRAQ